MTDQHSLIIQGGVLTNEGKLTQQLPSFAANRGQTKPLNPLNKSHTAMNIRGVECKRNTESAGHTLEPSKHAEVAAWCRAMPACFRAYSAWHTEDSTALLAKTRPSSRELLASLLAPCSPVQATSPQANRPIAADGYCEQHLHLLPLCIPASAVRAAAQTGTEASCRAIFPDATHDGEEDHA